MATTILRKLTHKLFSIMVDETTDVSNTEQFVLFFFWYVDDQLKSHEEFIGLHSLDPTTV